MKASPLLLAAAVTVVGVSSAHAQMTALQYTCDADARERALKSLKEETASDVEQATELKAAEAAIAVAYKLNADALSGLEVPQPYSGAAYWAKLAAKAPSPELAELYTRAAKDQLTRFQVGIAIQRIHWAAGLSDAARGYAHRIIQLDGCGVDQANTAWLKERLKAHGWYTIDTYGKEADQAAFLLAQHADRDAAFQAEVLPQLEKLAQEGKARPTSYAMLYDRVAVAQKRLQRYGSQGRCNDQGVWTAFETEDPANLDQRRASMGLQPAADYAAVVGSRACKRA
uniref:DUF6624 domain-containing protein n=1 Tax=uncultured Caulobacter sp. TaxID=158749 RepID=UPI0025E80F77|nr:DUF6624 domain-containing protein [uncultured Caulobacter sp.]